jgi:hypothetical protein
LKGIIRIESTRGIPRVKPGTGKIERETSFYITSKVWLVRAQLGPVIRSHWVVENSLKVMHMVFRDNECRIRTDHASANFTTLKYIVLNLTRRAPASTVSASDPKSPHGLIDICLGICQWVKEARSTNGCTK